MNNTNQTASQERRQPAERRKTPGYYYPEVVAYIELKRRLRPRICEVELARCLRGNEIAKRITEREVREIILGLRSN